MAGELKILEINVKSEEIIYFYLVVLQILMRLSSKLPCFFVILFISRKRYLIGEELKNASFSESRNRKDAGC